MVLDITKCHAGGLDISEACAVGGGVCQHHGAAYCEYEPPTNPIAQNPDGYLFADGATILSCAITTTERCCIAVNAATLVALGESPTGCEIERPLATIRTTQEDSVVTGSMRIFHHAAWEVLNAGTYTYYLVNRKGSSFAVYGAWIKAIASDCEG